jgi:Stage II sporulation protein E (SpoIIE)
MSTTWIGRLSRRGRRVRRRLGDAGVAAVLIVISVVLALASLVWPTALRPTSAESLPLLVGGLLLPRRELRMLIASSVLLVVAVIAVTGSEAFSAGTALVYLAIIAVSYEWARRRDRVGLRAVRADVVLVELRERLRVHGELPPLPSGWVAEVELRPAYDSGMAGDFAVSRLDTGPDRAPTLDLALVDVSGKGVDAGTRALLLSGALGGLLGAVPPDRFLIEANRYLLRQRWPEGFATAVYLHLELDTGMYRIENAGHPPAVQLEAGSGKWQLARSRGPLLGIFEDVRYRPDTGRLRPGDALLLYTDGLIEDRTHELEVGLDRMLGAAERLIPRGTFRGGASYLVDQAPARTDDDRAVVLLWRER